jgi:hypothetical protein
MSRLQVTKKLGVAIGATFLLFILILTFANFKSFDEPLSAEVTQALLAQKMPADRNNAYVAIWGLTAANDKDMLSAGRAILKRYQVNQAQRGKDELTEQDYQEILANKGLDKTWQSKIDNCHVRKHQDCSLKLARQMAQQPIESPRLDLLMQRYQRIKSLNDYQNINHLTFATPLPPFGPLLGLTKLSQAKALNNYNPSEFIAYLSTELKFWRMLLSQGDTIMDKMIANVGYRINLAATSNFLSSNTTLSKPQIAKLKQLLSPLSPSELDISEAFLFEEKAFYNTLKNIDADQLKEAFGLSSSPMAWLIQPNATINDYHELFVKKIQQLGALDTAQFAKAITLKKGDSCCFEEMRDLSSISFSALYNLGGKSLLTATLFNGQDYLARIHDLNGMIGLTQLQLSLIEDKVTANSWLDSNTSILGHSIVYHQQANSIEFDCLDKHSVCKVQL